MKSRDREYIGAMAEEHGVKFIRLWFTDVLGFAKGVNINIDELDSALEEGVGFDGSSIQGFARIDESDMILMPDPNTFYLLPWRARPESSVARMFCDVLYPDGTPYPGDPRHVLKQNLSRAASMGFTFYVGIEMEFFFFKNSHSTEVLDEGGYFDQTPLDLASDLRRDAVDMLEEMGIGVEFSHHEVAPSQHEMDLRYCDALTMADNAMTFKLVVKEVAMQAGCYASFMPKPLHGMNGSGMHTHQSLFRGDENAFFDSGDPNHLSLTGKQFIAGLLRHAPEITLLTNQWVNSYKRLVAGYEAPVYISWATRNRSDLIRVPMYKPGKERATRVEYRSPDPSCNPYLAFAAMLGAGLEGIEKGYELPAPVEKNVYQLTSQERDELGIRTLPDNLHEAIRAAEESELVRRILGDHVFEKLIENKKIEWEEYRRYVTDYELNRYLPIL
ncbi:MAG TPA: glutamine synthetase family protein [Armatimonadota bacterium]|nr:glutamine synthetase family protein [Armatimonadota bacterium]